MPAYGLIAEDVHIETTATEDKIGRPEVSQSLTEKTTKGRRVLRSDDIGTWTSSTPRSCIRAGRLVRDKEWWSPGRT